MAREGGREGYEEQGTLGGREGWGGGRGGGVSVSLGRGGWSRKTFAKGIS